MSRPSFNTFFSETNVKVRAKMIIPTSSESYPNPKICQNRLTIIFLPFSFKLYILHVVSYVEMSWRTKQTG